MTNAELRAAIEKTAALVHDLFRRTSPEHMERETGMHRRHLEALLAVEVARAQKESGA